MNRKSYRKQKDFLPLPNLLETPLSSFKRFIDSYIDEVLTNIFPISDYNNKYEFRYLYSEISSPEMTEEEAREKGMTYSVRLNARIQYLNHETKEVQESTVFLGNIPYMTKSGQFIIRGVGRVLVSQIIKSPGIFLLEDKKQLMLKIQPVKGTWLSFEYDGKGILNTRIDNREKVLSTIFLKAMGVGNQEKILELFDQEEGIKKAFEKDQTDSEDRAVIDFYKKLRPGDSPHLDRARTYIETLFSDPKKYDISPTGRRKMNQKLSLKERAVGKKLARDTKNYKSGTYITEEIMEDLKNEKCLYVRNKEGEEIKIIGNGSPETTSLTKEDLIAGLNYLFSYQKGIGTLDDIDHLSNRRLRLVGEIMRDKFQQGMSVVERLIREKLNVLQDEKATIQSLFNIKPLASAMNELLGSSQLSQVVDQVNPLSELSHKRRISAIGPGGVQKDRAGIEVRDVHYSHYGKEDTISTPEGNSVGLILQMSLYARVNEYGLLETPYVRVRNGKITDEIVYMTADEDERYNIIKPSEFNADGTIKEEYVTVRRGKEYPTVRAEEVQFSDVSMQQMTSADAALIPFVENDDANRAAMGTNMQRQAIPLIFPEEPIVGTGMEEKIAVDTGASYIAEEDGTVIGYSSKELIVFYKTLGEKRYLLNRFVRSDNNMCFHHYVRVAIGQEVKKGDVLADSTSSRNGELALGTNLLVAMLPWEGYNFEDAILLSERVVKEDTLTHIDISEYPIDVRVTRLGEEEITREIPSTKNTQKEKLDENGIVKIGTKVNDLDILVGKLTPKVQEEQSPEEKLLHSVINENTKKRKDNSLRLPHRKKGKVIRIIKNTKEDAKLPDSMIAQIKVQLMDIRKIIKGDKMAGKHGNKGVVAKILREEDMPYLEDGTPVDIVLNPLGVPSRMNIGQIMEAHLGIAGKMMGIKYETPIFNGANEEDIRNNLKEAGLPETGKFTLYDGRTGEKFENPVMVGVMHMMKLNHQAADKMHARSTGHYQMVTQQPLGGKSQMGGQRFGEMEVWALEAYGAAYTLQEMMTLKSDDIQGRYELFESILNGTDHPEPSMTEAFKVLMAQLRSLLLDPKVYTEDGEEIFKVEKEALNYPVLEKVYSSDFEEKDLDDEDEDEDDEDEDDEKINDELDMD